jgi:hypothetical protein
MLRAAAGRRGPRRRLARAATARARPGPLPRESRGDARQRKPWLESRAPAASLQCQWHVRRVSNAESLSRASRGSAFPDWDPSSRRLSAAAKSLSIFNGDDPENARSRSLGRGQPGDARVSAAVRVGMIVHLVEGSFGRCVSAGPSFAAIASNVIETSSFSRDRPR